MPQLSLCRLPPVARLAIGVFALLTAAPARSADEAAARKLLEAKGLVAQGRVWYLRGELELRERLDGLDALEKRLLPARQTFDALVEQNEALRLRLAAAEELLKSLRERSKAAPAGLRKPAEDEEKKQSDLVQQLKRSYIPAKRFGETPPGKPAVIEFVNVRNELALALLGLRRKAAPLPSQYRALADDPQVTAALAALGGATLAPAKTSYLDSKRMARFEALTFNDRAPLFREGNFYRLSLIVNEELPITVSVLDASADPLVLPATMAQALGLKYDPQQSQPMVFSGRRLQVAKTTVGELRLGKFVWSDVEAYVLPPDAENLGAQLGLGSLNAFHLVIDPNKLRLELDLGK